MSTIRQRKVRRMFRGWRADLALVLLAGAVLYGLALGWFH